TGPATRHELSLSAGRTIVNSFNSELAAATSLEYRYGLGRDLDWTVTWLNEGDARVLRRQGVAMQLWLRQPLLNERLALGVGTGPYLAVDRDKGKPADDGEHERLAGLLSITARYRMSPDFLVR